MIRTAARALWDEPRVPAPGGRPWWDVLLVAVLLPATVAEGLLRDDVPWPAFSIAAAAVCVVALLWRRSHPLVATVVAFSAQTLAGVLPDLAGLDHGVLDTTSCVLLFPYSLCRWGSGRAATAGVAFVLAAHLAREPLYGETATDIVIGAGFLLLPAASGAAVRFATTSQRRRLEQVRTREREQLARELHDTVAHHVSGIVIQAQAGRAVAATDPSAAAGVLEVIEQAAVRSLAEMRTIVGLLRADDGAAERAPVGGVADLPALARDMATRHTVTLRVQDDLRLDPALDAAVYRLVQESLTNARRHARGADAVEISVAADGADVHVSVTDDGEPVPRSRGAGFGVTGMAERVSLLGGTFAAGPGPHGGWAVRATLPRRPSGGEEASR